jgi:hypothetical protein
MLGDTVESCEEKRKEIAAKITQLNKDYSADQDAVKADYDKAMDAPHKPSELQKYKDMAVADAKRRLTDLDTAYNSKITDLQSQLLAVMAIENVLKKAQMQSGQK